MLENSNPRGSRKFQLSDPKNEFEEIDSRPIKPIFVVSDMETIRSLTSPLRHQILSLLIEEDLTIKMISDKIHKNPGSVKRVLTDLMEKHLIYPSKTEKNRNGISLKFYRACAHRFKIRHDIPPSTPE